VEDAQRHYGGAGLLAFGAPDFDSVSAEGQPVVRTRTARRRGTGATRLPARFGALPGTERELREIAALWDESLPHGSQPGAGALLMTGAAASPERFLALAPGRRVLHCATHGYALDPPRVAGTDPSGTPAAFAASVNPLELSGLALAGANQWRSRAGRGLLTSSAIATLDLGATEWVVLSSCGSGIGALMDGEGVLGMQRAFQAAGAGTVITSLWEVDDLSARRWMRALYTARFQHRMSTADATRAASLELLRELRAHGASSHPYGWGAFVAVGDWR
jgi:CHAT domain-containing protein